MRSVDGGMARYAAQELGNVEPVAGIVAVHRSGMLGGDIRRLGRFGGSGLGTVHSGIAPVIASGGIGFRSSRRGMTVAGAAAVAGGAFGCPAFGDCRRLDALDHGVRARWIGGRLRALRIGGGSGNGFRVGTGCFRCRFPRRGAFRLVLHLAGIERREAGRHPGERGGVHVGAEPERRIAGGKGLLHRFREIGLLVLRPRRSPGRAQHRAGDVENPALVDPRPQHVCRRAHMAGEVDIEPGDRDLQFRACQGLEGELPLHRARDAGGEQRLFLAL